MECLVNFDQIKPSDVKHGSHVNVPADENTFEMVISDASGAPRYSLGDIVVIDPDVSPRPGDDVVAIVSGYGVMRSYRPDPIGHGAALSPHNPDWPTLQLTAQDRLIGVCVARTMPRRA
jgi:SOS-response transcriptional repressor LexA